MYLLSVYILLPKIAETYSLVSFLAMYSIVTPVPAWKEGRARKKSRGFNKAPTSPSANVIEVIESRDTVKNQAVTQIEIGDGSSKIDKCEGIEQSYIKR